ncbi:uncharacterized protein LOC117882892 [Trachemys scripta elegans]|uniref:uncharacterized protein LOC117882892 n=1 Tax=Trachemys scripta elegans TaxID=31138 RepID=UPI0015555ADB|nr:uncharacterized protein LOC117882892 [Trachemys scripta elegans]
MFTGSRSNCPSAWGAEKLTLGGIVQVYSPHMVQALLDTKGGLWLTQARVAQYQAKLLENPEVTLQTCPSLNPATMLPETEEQEHDCLDITDAQYSSHPDLKDQLLPNADCEWYTDGSSTVIDRQRRVGYAVVTLYDTVEAEGLPAGTSVQLAELVALTRALELSKGKRVNIFTDSRYALGVLHAHAGLWKQRGMLTAQGSPVKHGPRFSGSWKLYNSPQQWRWYTVRLIKGKIKMWLGVMPGRRGRPSELLSWNHWKLKMLICMLSSHQ